MNLKSKNIYIKNSILSTRIKIPVYFISLRNLTIKLTNTNKYKNSQIKRGLYPFVNKNLNTDV